VSEEARRDLEIGRLLGRLDAIERDLALIKERLEILTDAFNMGRGSAIAAAKIGGLLVLALGALAWLVDHLPAWITRS